MAIAGLQTPALLVELSKFDANAVRLRDHAARYPSGVVLRPHMKTVKSVELGRRLTNLLGAEAITVSTLKEAEIYAATGYRDILYAVGIVHSKLPRVAALRALGVDLQIVCDNPASARSVSQFCSDQGCSIPVLIEVDCDGHRSGVAPGDTAQLLAIADALQPGAELRGVMTHAGGSYGAATQQQLQICAQRERDGIVQAAQSLRGSGHRVTTVSLGSTPTALNLQEADGITEVRAGVFAFFDLVMAGIGVCDAEDIALCVLTSVIGHQPQKGWVIVDAGWMAMSRDRGTQAQAVDQGYGVVCDVSGKIIPDLIMQSANQEHGILAMRERSSGALPDLPVGTQLRILPNHACATAAQHGEYVLVSEDGASTSRASRFNGW